MNSDTEPMDAEQLRRAFTAHEHLTPDAEAVYTAARARARSYLRRRRTAQAAGSAVLGAGVVVTATNLAGWLPQPGQHGGQAGSRLTLSAAAQPSVTPSPLTAQQQAQALDKYFAAGYGYADALQLAKLWHTSADISKVKAEAGRRLLAGQTLPIKPSDPQAAAKAKAQAKQSSSEAADLNAFFAAGYTYDDAVQLAQLWRSTDPYHAKITAGQKLLAGQTLPIKP